MSFARVLLHGLAVVLPVVMIGVAFGLGGGNASEIVPLAAVSVIAAQLAALAGWPLLDSAARRPGLARPVLAGLAMALLTHVLFGVVASLYVLLERDVLAQPGALLRSVVFYLLMSLVLAGWATAPALMVLTVGLCRLRREELAMPAARQAVV